MPKRGREYTRNTRYWKSSSCMWECRNPEEQFPGVHVLRELSFWFPACLALTWSSGFWRACGMKTSWPARTCVLEPGRAMCSVCHFHHAYHRFAITVLEDQINILYDGILFKQTECLFNVLLMLIITSGPMFNFRCGSVETSLFFGKHKRYRFQNVLCLMAELPYGSNNSSKYCWTTAPISPS